MASAGQPYDDEEPTKIIQTRPSSRPNQSNSRNIDRIESQNNSEWELKQSQIHHQDPTHPLSESYIHDID